MEQIFKKKFIYKGFEEKGTVNLYTLINTSMSEEDFTAIGNKIEGLATGDMVEAEIRVRALTKPLYDFKKDKNTYEKVWVNDAKFFINSMVLINKEGDA